MVIAMGKKQEWNPEVWREEFAAAWERHHLGTLAQAMRRSDHMEASTLNRMQHARHRPSMESVIEWARMIHEAFRPSDLIGPETVDEIIARWREENPRMTDEDADTLRRIITETLSDR